MTSRYALAAIAIMGLYGAGAAVAGEAPPWPAEHEAPGSGHGHGPRFGPHPMMLPGGIVLSPEQEAKVSAILDRYAANEHPPHDPKAMMELHRLLSGSEAPTADQVAKAKADALVAYGHHLDAEISRANERREIMAVLTPAQARTITERHQLQHLFGGPERHQYRGPGGPGHEGREHDPE